MSELEVLREVAEAAKAVLEFVDPHAEFEPESGVASARLVEALTKLEAESSPRP